MHHPSQLGKLGWIVLALSALSGCRFSASGSAEASTQTGADANAQASLQTQTEAPPAPPPPSEPRQIQLVGSRLDYRGVINFEYDKADLQNDDATRKTLDEFKNYLDRQPGVAIEVQGHTDSRGSEQYNRDLSDRRAATVRKWLVDRGIAADRITSVGKGEDAPQIPEPDQCNDKEPEDTKPCEESWGANRRVVFEVTKGAETIKEEPAPAPPPPAPAPAPVAAPAAPPPAAEECPWLWGGHANILGPNSWFTLAGATQPGVCWLELSLGVGLGFGDVDATSPTNIEAEGDYWTLTIPLRGRIWFFDRHSLIGDVGIGISHYEISADAGEGANDFEYDRSGTPLIGHLGLGYGFRPNRSNPGFRFAVVAGPLFHLTSLGDSESTARGTFAAADAAALTAGLDDDSDELEDIEAYAEFSFGLLF